MARVATVILKTVYSIVFSCEFQCGVCKCMFQKRFITQTWQLLVVLQQSAFLCLTYFLHPISWVLRGHRWKCKLCTVADFGTWFDSLHLHVLVNCMTDNGDVLRQRWDDAVNYMELRSHVELLSVHQTEAWTLHHLTSTSPKNGKIDSEFILVTFQVVCYW